MEWYQTWMKEGIATPTPEDFGMVDKCKDRDGSCVVINIIPKSKWGEYEPDYKDKKPLHDPCVVINIFCDGKVRLG